MTTDLLVGGVIPENLLDSVEMPEAVLASPAYEPLRMVQDKGSPRLWGYTNPVTAQAGPTCAGHAFANLVEVCLRRDMPPEKLRLGIGRKLGTYYWQIDGARVHRKAREAWYGGDLSGGLRMREVARLPELTGLLGPGVKVITIQSVETEKFEAAFHKSPVLLGLFTAPTWRNPDPKTAWIRPAIPNLFGGHLVMAVSVLHQKPKDSDDRVDKFVCFLNSWGPQWGRYGYGILNLPYAQQCWIDFAVAFELDEGWWEQSTWEEWLIPHED